MGLNQINLFSELQADVDLMDLPVAKLSKRLGVLCAPWTPSTPSPHGKRSLSQLTLKDTVLPNEL
jgi:hypothetical protein